VTGLDKQGSKGALTAAYRHKIKKNNINPVPVNHSTKQKHVKTTQKINNIW